jgi:SAM-dependent methyltransferase
MFIYQHRIKEAHSMTLHQHSSHASHSHGQGGHGHILRTSDNGASMMALMAHVGQFIDIEHWLNDYRSNRIVPVSNTTLGIALLALIAGIGGWMVLPAGINFAGLILGSLAGLYLLVMIIGGAALLNFFRRRRADIRAVVLGSVPWQGIEQVLDVGCGTGLLTNAVAGKLSTGKATGIDLWQQAIGGSADILKRNAQAEGVSDKIELQEMDARKLTFKDASFNVVVSSMALHHIATSRAECEQALNEMVRVLAPGGYFSLVDIGPMMDIAEPMMKQAGLQITRDTYTSFFRIVTAQKA